MLSPKFAAAQFSVERNAPFSLFPILDPKKAEHYGQQIEKTAQELKPVFSTLPAGFKFEYKAQQHGDTLSYQVQNPFDKSTLAGAGFDVVRRDPKKQEARGFASFTANHRHGFETALLRTLSDSKKNLDGWKKKALEQAKQRIEQTAANWQESVSQAESYLGHLAVKKVN